MVNPKPGTKFTDLIKKTGVNVTGKITASRNWFANTLKNLANIIKGSKNINGGSGGNPANPYGPQTSLIDVGRMYMFIYDPKTKEDLPYYDMFPLVFPFKKLSDGFLGINLHYLPIVTRARLLDMLYNYVTDPDLSPRARLKISYEILSTASTSSLIKPCIKRYLTSHVRSPYNLILPDQWDTVVFLPFANWAKASEQEVWADSLKQIGTY